MDIHAIIFDCDGVLIDSERIIVDTHLQVLGELGLVYPRDVHISRFMGIHNRDYHAALAADAKARGIDWPEDVPARLRSRTWARYKTELQPTEGVAAFAERLSCPMAVASSSETESLNTKLRMTGLHGLFSPHIYSGDLVDHGKPAPDLFLYAARQLGTDPARCLVIEDSPNGVKAGRAAGMTVVGFTGGGHVDAGLEARLGEAGAHMMAASFKDLGARLARR
ncbi:HAD family hydrolase [Henriciella litoralis]|uniref:HAD family hydrolase n=1 Tax=Henriciella litoralis TaxID=568102 RepID=UPI000A0651F6|nr:HAD family hydrolase [Henriciella litoralis]